MPATANGLAMPFHSDTSGLTLGSLGRPSSCGLSACLSTYITCVPPTPCGLYRPAFWKPRSFNSPARFSPYATMSSLVPKPIAPVGQVFTHAGSRPTATRSEHSVHLYALLSCLLMRGTSNGQPVTQ